MESGRRRTMLRALLTAGLALAALLPASVPNVSAQERATSAPSAACEPGADELCFYREPGFAGATLRVNLAKSVGGCRNLAHIWRPRSAMGDESYLVSVFSERDCEGEVQTFRGSSEDFGFDAQSFLTSPPALST
jgi:hypothetical protein